MVEEHFLVVRRTLAERKQLQHLVFLARQMHALAVNVDGLGVEIDAQIAGFDDRLSVTLGTADDRLDASNQFVLMEPVSYTHLRAHETVLDLVCRLLLEKTNTNNYTQHHQPTPQTYSQVQDK